MPTLQSDELRCNISSDGAIVIERAGGAIASGKLTMREVSQLFNAAPVEVFDTGKQGLDASPAFIENFEHVVARYSPKLSGPDLTITVEITNLSRRQTLGIVRFTLPEFNFGKPATGNIHSWNESYFANTGTEILHPSHWNNTAGVYATDGSLGVGLSTRSHLCKRSMFHARWIRDMKDMEVPQKIALEFYAEINLPPGETTHVDFTLRIGDKQDWKYLLANYQRDYGEQLGILQYEWDARPWAQSVPASKAWVSHDNPLGFERGGAAQLDWDAGCRRFVNERIAPLMGICQGAILWNPQGFNPRGAEYRPDFDVFPASVEANLPILRKGFSEHGVLMGLCTRPMDMIQPLDATTDTVVRLDPEESTQVASLLGRFTHAEKFGFNAFYLDSCGAGLSDSVLMQKLRGALGKKAPTFAEQHSDLLLPFSGLYVETQPEAGFTGVSPGNLEIYRWLMPGMKVIAVNRANWPLEELYVRQITPMVELYEVPKFAEQLKRLNAQYLDRAGQWK